MSLVVVVVILTIASVSLAGIVPLQSRFTRHVKSPRSQSCNIVNLLQKTGDTQAIECTNLPAKDCFDIPDHQTTVRLNNPWSCRYKVEAFSAPGCVDDTWLPSPSPITLSPRNLEIAFNVRQPVCSFIVNFPKNSPASTGVAVTFSGGVGSGTKREIAKESRCYNLCSGPDATYYPDKVEVHKVGTDQVASGHTVELFSREECEFGSEIGNAQGKSAVAEGVNLAELTRSGPKVRSYKIMRSR